MMMMMILSSFFSIGVTIFDHDNEANDTQDDDNDSSSDDDDGEAGIIIHAGNQIFMYCIYRHFTHIIYR